MAFLGTWSAGSSWLVSCSGFWPRPDRRSLLSCLSSEGCCWHSGVCGRWPVQVAQARVHVVEYACTYLLRQDSVAIHALGEGAVEELHHQNRKVGAVFKVDPEKLHDIWVLESTQQLAFLLEAIDHILWGGVLEENGVELLSRALEPAKAERDDSGVGPVSDIAFVGESDPVQ